MDEEKGLVLAGGFIDHSGRLDKYTTTDGVVHDPPLKSPHSFCYLEMFKIVDGRIRHAESLFITVPYRMPSPWYQRRIINGAGQKGDEPWSIFRISPR